MYTIIHIDNIDISYRYITRSSLLGSSLYVSSIHLYHTLLSLDSYLCTSYHLLIGINMFSYRHIGLPQELVRIVDSRVILHSLLRLCFSSSDRRTLVVVCVLYLLFLEFIIRVNPRFELLSNNFFNN